MENIEGLRILLVDDEPLLLESLEIILTLSGMQIVGKAKEGQEALALLANHPCDLALVDLNMKGMGGIELISHMKAEYPDISVLVLTTFYDDKSITQAIAGGADGYLLKDSGKEAILGAVSQIVKGQNVIDSKVMQRLAALMSQREENVTPDGETTEQEKEKYPLSEQENYSVLIAEMTDREKEICTLLAEGLTNKEIAKKLYISEGTVKNYISNVYAKTGIHDRAKLAVLLAQTG